MTDAALLSAEELSAHFSRRLLSPVEALQEVTKRIDRHNPRINAFAVLDPRSSQAAADSEARWAAGRPLSPIDGVPVTIKDLIDVAGLPTRRGSRLTEAGPVAEDAPIATALRLAGAVIVGKTTTTEYGWKTPGDCPLHGITRNPWNHQLTPGGSSSGAAAAASACFGPLHVGTDAGGSIRIPAAWCGVVGLKPTFGRVPQWPLGAFGAVAVAGPIARTVGDAALMLGAIGRFDLRDPYCLPDDSRDWRAGIDAGVAGLRIAVLRAPGFEAPVEWDSIAAVEDAAGVLIAAGAEVEQVDAELPDTRAIFSRIWGAALGGLVGKVPEMRRHMLDPGLLPVAASAAGATAADMLEAEALRIAVAHAMARLHQKFDLVLCPTVPNGPMPADEKLMDPVEALWTRWAPWTFLFNLSRQPAITVTIGFSGNGMPRSVQFAAAMYRDDLALRAARAIEAARPGSVPDLGAATG